MGVRMGRRWLWGRGWDGGDCGGEDGVEVVVGVRMGDVRVFEMQIQFEIHKQRC